MQKKDARIAGLAFLLITIIVVGDIITAAVSTSPLSVCPASPSSPCLTKVQSAPSAGSTCVLTSATSVNCPITFSPAYSSVPSMTWGATPAAFSPGQGFGFVNVPSGSIVFFSVESTGQTWLNMPSAVTEVFGDNGQHWVYVDWSAVPSSTNFFVLWQVSCPTASNAAFAYLTLQFSTDGGVTWKYLDSGTTTDSVANYHITIDGSDNLQGNCGTSLPAVNNAGLLSSIASPAAHNKEYLRIVGAGGGGVGDSPVFVSAQINLFIANPILCEPGATVTSTTLTLFIKCTAATTVTFVFRWRVGILA